MKIPYGIIEDVLVKIDTFLFLFDFVILEMPEDEEIPLIPWRPFLETGRCMIDIEEGTMNLKVYDEEIKIDVKSTMKHKDDVGTSNTVEVIDKMVVQAIQRQVPKLPLERVLSFSVQEIKNSKDDREKEVLAMLDAQPSRLRSKLHRWEDLGAP